MTKIFAKIAAVNKLLVVCAVGITPLFFAAPAQAQAKEQDQEQERRGITCTRGWIFTTCQSFGCITVSGGQEFCTYGAVYWYLNLNRDAPV